MNKCLSCNQPIAGRKRKYCDSKCSADYFKKNNFISDTESELSTATIGTVHELLVSADLLKKKWHVFRAISPSCPSDLIIMRNNLTFRIQVTKAKININTGTITYAPHKSKDYDILALSFTDGTIKYIPSLPD